MEQSPVAAALAWQRCFGSAAPLGTGEQTPTLPGTLQLLHSPPVAPSAQALSQQVPSVQNPLAHSAALAHTAPIVFLPHALFTQVLGATQSLSLLQVDIQASLLQVKGPQDLSAGVIQVPWPSHVEGGVAELALAHFADLHSVKAPA